MAVTFSSLLFDRWNKEFFQDQCSSIRHAFANLRLCSHVGRTTSMRELLEEEVQEAYDAVHPYPRIFNMEPKHDQEEQKQYPFPQAQSEER